jgi:hypothetical protein
VTEHERLRRILQAALYLTQARNTIADVESATLARLLIGDALRECSDALKRTTPPRRLSMTEAYRAFTQ